MTDRIVIDGEISLQSQIDGESQVVISQAVGDHDKLYNRDLDDQHPISAITGLDDALDGKADASDIPTKVSDLQNDAGYITSETDPTVPTWAKQSTKPTYTAQEVGALPDDTVIPTVPTNISAFNNDSGYITASALPTNVSDLNNDAGYLIAETDPTVPSWAKASSKPTYTASEVGALPDDTEFAIGYDEASSVGSAVVGEAVTAEPNYTPSGDATLDYEVKDGKLYIYGIIFKGSGVKFTVEKEQ